MVHLYYEILFSNTETVSFVTTQMELEIVILRGLCQAQKEKCHIILFIIKNKKIVYKLSVRW